MPNIASMLKEEMARISRKESRRLVDPLKKQLIAQRHAIAALKREIAALAKDTKRVVTSKPERVAETHLRFSPAGLRSLRKKLGLSAQDLGRLFGVGAQSVYNWELNKVSPRPAQLQRIARLRGMGKREVHRLLETQHK